MTKELKPCPFCGGGLHLEDWPWCDGTPCFEVWHDDFDHAVKMRCPLVMGGYDTEEDGTKAVNTRYKRTCNPVENYNDGSPWPVMVCSECGRPLHYDETNDECEYAPYCCCGAEVIDA